MGVLQRAPLEYYVHRQRGSHRTMRSANGYPQLSFSWHDGVTIPPGLVRKVLVEDAVLAEQEALDLL